MQFPKISVIIPTFNEEGRIKDCLLSVRSQIYPQNKIEILVIDDNSTDLTVRIAKEFNIRVYKNGSNNIERGKSIGLEHSKGELIFFLDADNILTSNLWFKKCLKIFNENSDLVGIQSFRFLYKRNDSIPNRYCALFGVNDPMVFYLGRRGLLTAYEHNWIYPKTFLKEKKDYFLTHFTVEDLPTIGSQGYMVKKKLLLKTKWKPYLFHLDSTYDLVKLKYDKFAFIKLDSEHNYSERIIDMIGKWDRNISLYWKYQSIRRYKYQLTKFKLALVILEMITIIIPLKDSIKGYLKKRDWVWFLHPIFCLIVIFIYTKNTIKIKTDGN